MVFNATFNNISAISVSFISGGHQRKPLTRRMQITVELYHIMLYRVHFAWVGFELITLVAIGTDCIGSCKSNSHTITTTTTHEEYIYVLYITYLFTLCDKVCPWHAAVFWYKKYDGHKNDSLHMAINVHCYTICSKYILHLSDSMEYINIKICHVVLRDLWTTTFVAMYSVIRNLSFSLHHDFLTFSC